MLLVYYICDRIHMQLTTCLDPDLKYTPKYLYAHCCRHTASHPKDAKYPDTIAIVYDEVHKKLTCVYNDHSLYVWDIHDIRKVSNPSCVSITLCLY